MENQNTSEVVLLGSRRRAVPLASELGGAGARSVLLTTVSSPLSTVQAPTHPGVLANDWTAACCLLGEGILTKFEIEVRSWRHQINESN